MREGQSEGLEGRRVERAPRVAAREIDGRVVVIVLDKSEVHTLNEVGSFVWRCSDGRSVREIVEDVIAEFDVERPAALRDVGEFIDKMVALGALDVREGAP